MSAILTYRFRLVLMLHLCILLALSSFGLNLKAMEEDNSTICGWNNLPFESKLKIILYLEAKGNKIKEFLDYSQVSREFASLINDCPLSRIKTYKFSGRPKKISITDIFFKAVKEGHFKVVKTLIERGVDVNEKDKYKKTALIKAAEKGHRETVKLLLESGARIEAQDNGNTALMWAARSGHTETVSLLIENGANIDASDDINGNTALIEAASYGQTETAELLLENGAHIEVNDIRW